MTTRPFALLGAARLAAVRAALEGAAGTWARAWGLAAPALSIERAWEAAPHTAPWRYVRHGTTGQHLWLAWPDELAQQLQRGMFAPDKRHGPQQQADAGLAQAAGEAALAALADALGQTLAAGAASGGPEEPPAELAARASGAVRFELRLGKLTFQGALSHAAVQALAGLPAGALPALAPVSMVQTLAALPVHLQVAVGQAQVGLGSLLGLGVGDVVRLDTLAEQPLAVQDASGTLLMGGHLGIADNKLALEVVRGQTKGI